jgi:hypothetical protein
MPAQARERLVEVIDVLRRAKYVPELANEKGAD